MNPQVSSDEVLGTLKQSEPKLGTFVQRAGLWLALGVGLLIAIITVLLVLFLFLHYPATPQESQGNLDNYNTLVDTTTKTCLNLFDNIVVKALLPVFTAILGYIFGTRNEAGHGGGK